VNAPWAITIAPVAGLVSNALAQIVVAHVFRKQIGKSILAGILCGFGVTLAVTWLGATKEPDVGWQFFDVWLLGVATYLALSFGFWVFLNLNITSIRIRILRELFRAGGSIALADFLGLYSPAERLHRRIQRLEKGGQLIRIGDCWRLGSWQVLLIARCIEALRTLVLPPRSYHHSGQRR
jgi:hypothetical protein